MGLELLYGSVTVASDESHTGSGLARAMYEADKATMTLPTVPTLGATTAPYRGERPVTAADINIVKAARVAALQEAARKANAYALAVATYAPVTPEGGQVELMTNKTGSASIKGTLVQASTSVDKAFELPSTQYSVIGVVYESGVADGSLCLVVVGGFADVLFEDGETPTRGYWVYASDVTPGRAKNLASPPGGGIPEHDEHFKETGHCDESKSSGTGVLARCAVHPN